MFILFLSIIYDCISWNTHVKFSKTKFGLYLLFLWVVQVYWLGGAIIQVRNILPELTWTCMPQYFKHCKITKQSWRRFDKSSNNHKQLLKDFRLRVCLLYSTISPNYTCMYTFWKFVEWPHPSPVEASFPFMKWLQVVTWTTKG